MSLKIYDILDFYIKNKNLFIKTTNNNSEEIIFNLIKNNNIKDYLILDEKTNKKIFLSTAKNIIKIELNFKNFNGDILIYKINNEDYKKILEYIEKDSFNLDDNTDIIKLVDNILKKAVETRATDIHIEAMRNKTRIRFRLDGVLKEMESLDKEILKSLCSRIKILANLDIVEKRKPQDGRFSMIIDNKNIDFRVSTIPTMHGEKIELRLLYKYDEEFSMEDLSLSEKNYEFMKKALKSNSGIIILNGPTGSGKSTSLFVMIKELNKTEINISTVEDPIEYEIDGVNQVQCREDLGLSFASMLKFLLRQDPDILVIGEIRDKETAEIAVKSSLTGHLVLTTLHSVDSLGAVNRLLNLEIDNFMLSQVINTVISQRLVRKLCPHCKKLDEEKNYINKLKEFNIEEKYIEKLKNKKIYEAGSCKHCYETGYKGRIPVMEIMYFDDEMKKLLMKRASEEEIKSKAKEIGTRSLIFDALLKLEQGIISVDELGNLL